MRAYVTDHLGRDWLLPELTAWRMEYTAGVPCDSFWVRCPWEAGSGTDPAQWVTFYAVHEGERVFTGVVDECQCEWSEGGCTAELSGRGMQALLLDNQAEAADYGQATLEEILRNYVTPYGIQMAEKVSLPGAEGFSVASGSSCWKVLYEFARYHAGVTPRFDRWGRLVLSPWIEAAPIQLDQDAPVTRWLWREKRYGVLSQVTVKDVSGWRRQTETNETFQNRGGQCSRVILMPKNTGFQARRYNARFQLERSAAELRQVELTLAIPFAAWPGDLVSLTRAAWSGNGLYRVRESRVTLGARGCETTLVLGEPDGVF